MPDAMPSEVAPFPSFGGRAQEAIDRPHRPTFGTEV